jgi:hypothetical protein
MQNHLRLDDLLARDVTPQWFEGVALVQLICRQSRGRGAGASGFPRAADILIGPGGSIAIVGESVGNPVQAAAHVLALMLSDEAPVRLRLAVSQATATETGYATLADFSEALAYFERPNPESIVDAFRIRAMLAARREVASAPPRPIAATPQGDKHSAPQPVVPRARVSRLAVIAATISAVAATSVWLIGRGVPHLAAPEIAIAESGSVTPADGSRANRATNAEAAPLSKSVVGTGAATPPVETAVVAPRSARDAGPELQVSAQTLEYRYPDLLPFAASQPESSPTTDVPSDRTSKDDPDIEEASDRIYSKTDLQVTQPVNLFPRLPAEPAGVDRGSRTMLELTIAADGLVERVRMLTAPRNIHEFMLLSAAKAWRFEPARIGGRPVRFRQTMVLAAMP